MSISSWTAGLRCTPGRQHLCARQNILNSAFPNSSITSSTDGVLRRELNVIMISTKGQSLSQRHGFGSQTLRRQAGAKLRRHNIFYPTRSLATQNENAKRGLTEESLSSKKRRKAKGRAVAESLAPHDTLCLTYSNAVLSQPPKETKEQRRSVAVAEKFFSKGYDFLYSADRLMHHPYNNFVPEVVVLGASNAGKSSLLNALFGRTDAANVSSRPGRTATMNAYGIGLPDKHSTNYPAMGIAPPKHGLIMMDTPGYGHVSRTSWGDSICRYIEKRSLLKGAILLIPAQKSLTYMDKWVLRMLAERNKRTLVILTKADMAGKDWWAGCNQMAREIRAEMIQLGASLNNGWREGDGWVPDIYATAAGWARRRSVGNAPGMGGARKAILEHLAGFTLDDKLETRPEEISYGGDLVSWDDLLNR